jgi:23S rRNA (guanosine2251-2'-O)-methyltransferase
MIVGNELSGIDPELLEMCDQVLALPMLGDKTSLNVTVAFGIAAYYLQYSPQRNASTNSVS